MVKIHRTLKGKHPFNSGRFSTFFVLMVILFPVSHPVRLSAEEAQPDSIKSRNEDYGDSNELQHQGIHQALVLGLMHHLGYGKTYDPELASAWFHAAAYDGSEIALAILRSMHSPEIVSVGDDPSSQSLILITQIDPSLEDYFQKTTGAGGEGYTFNLEKARQWNHQQALQGNPIALYNCHILQAQSEQIRYLFAHTPLYYRRESVQFEDPELQNRLVDWMQHPENYSHADTWMFAYQNGLKTSGLDDTSMLRLQAAIDGGSLRARLYRLKYLNDSMLSENDSVASNQEEIEALLDLEYPPAWDVECARLLDELGREETVDDPEPYLNAIEKAVRFGYEFNPLRLLGTLMAKTLQESVFARGFKIYEKAAALEMRSSYYSMGFCYRYGLGVSADLMEAERWFEKSSQNHDAAADYQLGWILLGRQNQAGAFTHFESSAELGHELAQLQCALMLMEGVGVEANRLQAYTWFEAAAEQGNETASLFCGYYHDNAWLGGRDVDQSLYYYRKSIISQSEESFDTFFRFLQEHVADKDASVESMLAVVDEMQHWVPPHLLVNLGIVCWEHPQWEPNLRWSRASRYFETAAQRGSETGKLMTYVLCINGYPGHSTTEATAFFHSILEKPADGMDPKFRAQAVSALSLAYLNGMGTPYDYEAFLDLMDQEKLPEALRNRLDIAARQSNAYAIYRNRAENDDQYRRARFSARENAHRSPPAPVVQIHPQYPKYLREMGISGQVTITMIVDTEGHILAPSIEASSNPGFEEPAMRALAHWKFLPGIENGEPVKLRTRLPMVFNSTPSNTVH